MQTFLAKQRNALFISEIKPSLHRKALQQRRQGGEGECGEVRKSSEVSEIEERVNSVRANSWEGKP